MIQWEKQCVTLMKVERKYMMDSKQVNMMEVEAGKKLIEFGRQRKSEAQGTLEESKRNGSKNKMFKSMYKLTMLLS